MVWTVNFLFVSSFTEAQLGCFYFWVVRNNTVMIAYADVFPCVGAYRDVSLVLAKHLGTGHLHRWNVSNSDSGVWMLQFLEGVGASCPLEPEPL